MSSCKHPYLSYTYLRLQSTPTKHHLHNLYLTRWKLQSPITRGGDDDCQWMRWLCTRHVAPGIGIDAGACPIRTAEPSPPLNSGSPSPTHHHLHRRQIATRTWREEGDSHSPSLPRPLPPLPFPPSYATSSNHYRGGIDVAIAVGVDGPPPPPPTTRTPTT